MKLIYMALIPQSGVVTTGKFRSDKIKKRKIPFLRRNIGILGIRKIEKSKNTRKYYWGLGNNVLKYGVLVC